MSLRLGLVGKIENPERDPGVLLESSEAQALVQALAEGPLSGRAAARACALPIEKTSGILEDLRRASIVSRSRGDRYHLTWPLWKEEDGPEMDRAVDEVLGPLAASIREHWTCLNSLVSRLASAETVGPGQAALLVIGCLALDWGVIYGLNARGLLSLGRKHPDGSRYLLNLYQEGYRIDSGLASSHNQPVGRYFFTTFGEDQGYRLGFPDLFPRSAGWRVPDHPVFKTYQERYLNLAQEPGLDPALESARLLEDLTLTPKAVSPSPLSSFLQELGYLDSSFKVRAPVLLEQEAEILGECIRLVVDLVVDWVPLIKRSFGRLSPLRKEEPPWELCLMEIWHSVFGRLNSLLVEEGLFEVPFPQRSGEGVYIKGLSAGYQTLHKVLMEAVTPQR